MSLIGQTVISVLTFLLVAIQQIKFTNFTITGSYSKDPPPKESHRFTFRKLGTKSPLHFVKLRLFSSSEIGIMVVGFHISYHTLVTAINRGPKLQ